MTAKWTSNLSKFEGASNEGIRAGLIAAANVLVNQVKRNLKGGYTSGDFVTGLSLNSVTKSEPVRDGNEWSITVGTNLLYNLYWELGHHNIFTRKYERVEKWRPALMDSKDAMSAAFNRVYMRTVKGEGF